MLVLIDHSYLIIGFRETVSHEACFKWES